MRVVPSKTIGAHRFVSRPDTEKSVELFEAFADRPTCKRSGDAYLPCRGLMHFAESGRVVALQLQNFGNGRGLVGTDGIVSRCAGRQFGDRAHPDRMMIVACKERLARRRAQRRCMKLCVAQSLLRE